MKYEIGDSLRINIKGYNVNIAANVTEDGEVTPVGLYIIDPAEDGKPRYISEEVLDAIVQMGADVYHQTEQHIEVDPEEDDLVEIRNIDPGTTIEAGGIEMEILDCAYPSASGERLGVFCLAEDTLFEKAFDERNNNNWKKSSLRKYLNREYKENIDKELASALIPFNRNLLTDDGMSDYGSCVDLISLISEREYQDYREYISNKSDWWWTLTAWSANFNPLKGARYVHTDGSLYNTEAHTGSGGVSLAFLLNPSLKVKVISRFCKDE